MDVRFNAKWAALLILTAGLLQADKPRPPQGGRGTGAFIREPNHSPRLFGKVKSVRAERAFFILRDGQWVVGNRVLLSLAEYNTAGNLVRYTFYNLATGDKPAFVIEHRYDDSKKEVALYSNSGTGGNSFVRQSVWRYNEKGDKVEAEDFNSKGETTRAGKYDYTYDDAGRVTQRIASEGGAPRTKKVTTYVDGGKTEHYTRLRADGSVQEVTETESDSNGSTSSKRYYYGKTGALDSISVLTIDQYGNGNDRTTNSVGGKARATSNYASEYDAHGNPVRQTTTACGPRVIILLWRIHWEFGWACNPRDVIYSTYEYYPDAS